jgi:hypothetical protein
MIDVKPASPEVTEVSIRKKKFFSVVWSHTAGKNVQGITLRGLRNLVIT